MKGVKEVIKKALNIYVVGVNPKAEIYNWLCHWPVTHDLPMKKGDHHFSQCQQNWKRKKVWGQICNFTILKGKTQSLITVLLHPLPSCLLSLSSPTFKKKPRFLSLILTESDRFVAKFHLLKNTNILKVKSENGFFIFVFVHYMNMVMILKIPISGSLMSHWWDEGRWKETTLTQVRR